MHYQESTADEEPKAKKYKKYNEGLLEYVVNQVKEGKTTMKMASRDFNIPASTIEYRVKHEKVTKENDKRGALKILSDEEEHCTNFNIFYPK